MAKQWVYQAETVKTTLAEDLGKTVDAKTLRATIGGRAQGFLGMLETGLPVPPAFFIPAEASRVYLEAEVLPQGLWSQVKAAVRELEAQTGKTFGSAEHPLILAVLNSLRHFMPGLTQGLRFVGLNTITCDVLAERSQNPAFFYEAYARFIPRFAQTTQGVDPAVFYSRERALGEATLNAMEWRALAMGWLETYAEEGGAPFPQDPYHQLEWVLEAIFKGWNNERANLFREQEGIPHGWGTGVSVFTRVFGNLGSDSGGGAIFSRHPLTGEKVFYGKYLPHLNSYEVLYGYHKPQDVIALRDDYPELYRQLEDLVRRAESAERSMQMIFFVIEDGQLWVTGMQPGRHCTTAAVRMALDMWREDLLSRKEALERLTPAHVVQKLPAILDPQAVEAARKAGRLIATGKRRCGCRCL
jgi:pyruvate,orthophosphate dikinase